MIGHARISPRSAWAFAGGAVIGTLGGLIGLGLGSILGALASGHFVRYAAGSLLTVFLGIMLVISAIRLYATRRDRS